MKTTAGILIAFALAGCATRIRTKNQSIYRIESLLKP